MEVMPKGQEEVEVVVTTEEVLGEVLEEAVQAKFLTIFY
jgi:hypothetical protein